MKEIMKDLLSTGGVSGCIITDREGELIDFLGDGGIDDTLVSALIAEITKEIEGQMKIPTDFTISALANNGNIFMTVRKDFILVLLTEPNADTGEVRLRLRRGAKLLAKLI
ncbi:roadblock/LC7 domain-containing protein [candidate division WOR-3 bacterium]|nr:roadblock/LC7 domain-containing protein [candidate division WOR-3 bacterium]MCK4526989.1 roadblock/LC7 domain-containing protein [candidate division WOR-3 bacterium]